MLCYFSLGITALHPLWPQSVERCCSVPATRTSPGVVILAVGMAGYFPIPFQDTTPASSKPQPPPCIPYPEALIALHNLLRKRKTTLVNIFKKAGMEGRNIKKADFIKIIKQVCRAQESNKQLMLTLTFHRLQW